MSAPNGGFAFPQDNPIANNLYPGYGTDRGMTLRDHFAGLAMVALIGKWNGDRGNYPGSVAAAFSEVAYKQADAMLAERAK